MAIVCGRCSTNMRTVRRLLSLVCVAYYEHCVKAVACGLCGIIMRTV